MPTVGRGRPGSRPGSPSDARFGSRSASRPGAPSGRAASRPKRTEREAALDRIQEARAALARNSLWLKRGSVAAVALSSGIGALQGWPVVVVLAIPLALLFWWLDARLTRRDRRWQSLYSAVFEGTAEAPFPGEERAAANRSDEPPHALRRAMISGPGIGLHLMMLGIAILFNILV